MGSGGLQFDANDGFSAARGNQKTTFVGTGTEITNLVTMYPGMRAYCIVNGGAFVANTDYIRNAANNAWNLGSTYAATIIESAEQNTTPTTDNADFTPGAGGQFDRYYEYFTVPSTDKFILVTGLEWKNGATVNGNVVCGIDLVDTDGPTLDHTPLVGLGIQKAQSGASVIQRQSDISCELLRPGQIIGMWFSTDSITATFRRNTGASSKKHQKALGVAQTTPAAADATVWTAADTNQVYLKLYYKGYI